MKTAGFIALPLSIVFLAVGCGPQKAVSTSMSEKEKNALRASLKNLDEALKQKSPFIGKRLAPPATNEQLAKLRSELGGAKIECLEIWYRWHNGFQGGRAPLLPLGEPLSIEQAIADRKTTGKLPFVDAKRKNALKILEDGAGDGYFLDLTSGNPRVFYHMLEDPYPEDFGTLAQFVDFIAEVHAAGLAAESENGMIEFDYSRYEELEANYLNGIGN